ncbi:MAG: hypothetical protein ABJL32_07795, partial [Algoriphagus sp.]
MLKKLKFLALGLVGSLVLVSCTPDGAEYIDELDIVYTNYDVNYDFGSKGTFAVPDKIIKVEGQFINGNEGDFEPEFVSPVYST